MDNFQRIIVKLEGDSQALQQEIANVKKSFQQQGTELKQQGGILEQLRAKEQKLQQQRMQANNVTDIKRYNTELAKTQKQIQSLSGTASGATSIIKNMLAGFAAMVGIQQTIGFLKEGIQSAVGMETQERKLFHAFSENEEVQKRMIENAAKLSSTSLFKKSEIMDAQAFVGQLGRTEEQTNKMITAAMGLSRVTGVDMQTAMMQLSGTLEGTKGRLGRYSEEIKTMSMEDLQAGKAIDILNDKLGKFGTEGLDTIEGKTIMLGKAWDAFKRAIGEKLIIGSGAQEGLSGLTGFVTKLKDSAGTIVEVVKWLGVLGLSFTVYKLYAMAASAATKVWTDAQVIANTVTKWFTGSTLLDIKAKQAHVVATELQAAATEAEALVLLKEAAAKEVSATAGIEATAVTAANAEAEAALTAFITAETAAREADIVATNADTAAKEANNMATKSNPIGLVLAVVVAALAAIYLLTQRTRELTFEEKKLAAERTASVMIEAEANRQIYEKQRVLNNYLAIAKDATKTERERKNALRDITEATEGNIKVTDLSKKSLDKLTKSVGDYIEMIRLQASVSIASTTAATASQDLMMLDKELEIKLASNEKYLRFKKLAETTTDASMKAINEKAMAFYEAQTLIEIDYNKKRINLQAALDVSNKILTESSAKLYELQNKKGGGGAGAGTPDKTVKATGDVLAELRKKIQATKDEIAGLAAGEGDEYTQLKAKSEEALRKDLADIEAIKREAISKSSDSPEKITEAYELAAMAVRLAMQKNAEQWNADYAAFDIKRREAVLSANKELADLEIELRENEGMIEHKDYAARIQASNDYYDELIALAQLKGEDITAIKILEGKKQLEADKLNKEQIDEITSQRTSQLEEEQRHWDAMAKINSKNSKVVVAAMIEFEQEKLRILEEGGKKGSEEWQKQVNKIEEMTAEMNSKGVNNLHDFILKYADSLKDLLSTSADALNTIFDGINQRIERNIQLQQKRVDAAKILADKGNAAMYEAEKQRMDKLLEERKKNAEKQKAISEAEMVVQAMLAIATTIAANAESPLIAGLAVSGIIIALAAGLLKAQDTVDSATSSFYSGGYTGDGTATQESKAKGRKPYKYHKAEFIFDHEKTAKNRDLFEDIHRGKMNLRDTVRKASILDSIVQGRQIGAMDRLFINRDFSNVSGIEDRLDRIENAIHGQPGTDVIIDEGGIAKITQRHVEKVSRQSKISRP